MHGVGRCSSKWVFLKISQISLETPALESPFNKIASLKASTQLFSSEIFEILWSILAASGKKKHDFTMEYLAIMQYLAICRYTDFGEDSE